MSVTIVGVRHHSPACTRLVVDTIQRVKPAFVLIEGPSDFNERMHELTDFDHTLPIALFHYATGENRRMSSFTPLSATSPEWHATQQAKAIGATVKFIDLPSWDTSFDIGTNRTADRVDRYARAVRRLCADQGCDGPDSLWDHLFEQPHPTEELRAALDVYFHNIRSTPGERDARREAFMAQCIAWAAIQGDVVVVCGGFHKPELERAWPQLPPTWPTSQADPEIRTGTHVVPFSEARLDAFDGYAAGLSSPGFYRVQQQGGEQAVWGLVDDAITALRDANVMVSTADQMAVRTNIVMLARIRGHAEPLRVDVLDGLCSALIKEGLDVAPPWTTRTGIAPGTAAELRVILQVFQGNQVGSVDDRVTRPPLVQDVRSRLANYDLDPSRDRRVDLDLDTPSGVTRSRLLHQLRVLEIPGFERLSGPKSPVSTKRVEVWRLWHTLHTDIALLQASQYGGTLAHAATTVLRQRLAPPAPADILVRVLTDAVFTGFDALAREILPLVRTATGQMRQFAETGPLLRILLDLWRGGAVWGIDPTTDVQQLLIHVVDRAIHLFGSDMGPSPDPHRQTSAAALGQVYRYAPMTPTEQQVARDTFARRACDSSAPIDLRGAATGLEFQAGLNPLPHVQAVLAQISPDVLGDYLAGLLAVSRVTVIDQPDLLLAIESRIEAMDPTDFMAALPALRMAFHWFPPRERGHIAQLLAAAFGQPLPLHTVAPTDLLIEGATLDAAVTQDLVRFGLVGESHP